MSSPPLACLLLKHSPRCISHLVPAIREPLDREASPPASIVVERSPAFSARWPGTTNHYCILVTLPLAVPTVALTIQEAPPRTAPKALGLWTAPKSTSSLTAADSRSLGLWQSLTTDKEQQTNTSLAGKSQKAAHHPRNLKWLNAPGKWLLSYL